jgi:folate-dependent phosphoribosylglycinamide formyltransferase PurN
MYNGHPGLITYYPELKGKDPQKRAWENIASYTYIGSVIHDVTAEVDSGNIFFQKKRFSVNCTSLDETYKELKETSLETWVEFLEDIL